MTHQNAKRHCQMQFDDWSIETRENKALPQTSPNWTRGHSWTGSTRHNLTHFKREDGLIFEPDGMANEWHFKPVVYIKISHNGVVEAYNSMDYANRAHSDNCLCVYSSNDVMKLLLANSVVQFTIWLLGAIISIVIVWCLLAGKFKCVN